jgi:hypothetical protein
MLDNKLIIQLYSGLILWSSVEGLFDDGTRRWSRIKYVELFIGGYSREAKGEISLQPLSSFAPSRSS